MNFNLKAAGTLLSRAKQFTEEKLGHATERTEYDEPFETLLGTADRVKFWTERLTSQVETVLQPNPNERLEDFILTKFDQKTLQKPNIIEQLGQCMTEAGHEFSPSNPYGSTLIKCGQTHQKLGQIHKEFVQSVAMGYMQPLRSYLEGEMKSITKERRSLEMKRLDLDAARSKQKKNQLLSHQMSTTLSDNFDFEVRQAQSEFERQYHITRLMLDGLGNSQNHHLSCLFDLVESEFQYHQKCLQTLEDLHKRLGLSKTMANPTTKQTRTGMIKFDYDASKPDEINVLAKEIVEIVSEADETDSIMVEKLSTKERGRIPKSYVQIGDS